MRKTKRGVFICALPIMGGIISGIVVLCLLQKMNLYQVGFRERALLGELEYVTYNNPAYLIYLIKMRGSQVGFVVAMSLIHRKELGAFIWAWLTGVGFGIGIYGIVFQCGAIGVLGYLLMIFPHYICYLWSYVKVILVDSNSQKIKVFGVVIIGIVLECYVNPMFLKIFLKIFF